MENTETLFASIQREAFKYDSSEQNSDRINDTFDAWNKLFTEIHPHET